MRVEGSTATHGDAAGNYVEIGHIRKPLGLKGWCGVTPHGATLGRLELPAGVWVGADAESAARMILTDARADPKGWRCLFEGHEDREAAEALRNHRLFIEKHRLPHLQKEQYYHFELEGMRVVSRETGEELGTVETVQNYPSVDAIEVRKHDGGLVLVPMMKDTIREIDRERGTIRLSVEHLDELFA